MYCTYKNLEHIAELSIYFCAKGVLKFKGRQHAHHWCSAYCITWYIFC
jgi:hypothetical protein